MRTLKRERLRGGGEDEHLWRSTRSPGLPISWRVCACEGASVCILRGTLHLNQGVKLFLMHVHGRVSSVCFFSLCVPALTWS